MSLPRTRVVVFVNKTWEATPLVCILKNSKALPNNFPQDEPAPSISVPLKAGGMQSVSPRAVFCGNQSLIEIWCIQDLMDPSANPSSSEEKARVIPFVIKNTASIVISVGTASYFDERSFNGCVVILSLIHISEPTRQ